MTTANISDFVSLAIPIGSSLNALDATINFTQAGAEYLRQGSIKAYDASYAVAIAAAPQLRVFGSDAKTYGTATAAGAPVIRYFFIGTNYIAVSGSYTSYCGTALNSIGTAVTNSANNVATCRPSSNGSAYLVVPHINANLAPWATANGTALTAVGGTFTTCPAKTAICFGNASWLSISSLNATAGEQTYIANANPIGTWTVGAGTNVSMTSATGLAYGAALFVAVGANSGTGQGVVATCAAVGGAWTDRTATCGIVFLTGETVKDILFDGTQFFLLTSSNRCYGSTDGLNYTARAIPMDMGALVANGYGNGAILAFNMTTDGAGTLAAISNTGATVSRVIVAYSVDHGVTWSTFQPYVGKAIPIANTACSISFANGRWIENHASNSSQSLVDIGTSLTAAPDYIGQQVQTAAGQYVRIK